MIGENQKISTSSSQQKIEIFTKKFSKEEKLNAILKYQIKRKNRNYSKIVRYERRQILAESRPRYKGRFIKPEILQKLKEIEFFEEIKN